VTALTGVGARAADTSAARQLERFNAQAQSPGRAERGRVFFTSRHGGEWSCASCHGDRPVAAGRHAGTGKAIEPLAPALNPRAFTDTAKVDKWFRRNCKDVAGRECSAAEKADVLAYLTSLQR
jgi:mono/diheme cytochrome c family protein